MANERFEGLCRPIDSTARTERGILRTIGGDDTTRTRTRTPPSDEPTQPSRAAEEAPEHVDRFRLIRRIGSGGMGQVFEAHDPELDRSVAVKLLRASRGTIKADSRRLLREARSLAQLNHPNVVEVFGAGVDNGRVWLAMELVEGKTLKDWANENPPGDAGRCELALDLLRQAAEGLAAAHTLSITHRDFKPSNVLVGADARVRVVDFGLARHGSSQAALAKSAESEPIPEEPSRDAVTRTGKIMGTPRYMAPEQHRGDPTSSQTDVFAFAVSAWEVLHASPPFDADRPEQLYAAIMGGRFRPPGDATVPARVNRALKKAMSASPNRRFGSIHRLLAAIDGRLQRRRAGLLATLSSVAVLAMFTSHSRRENVGDATERCKNEAQQLLDTVDTPTRRESIDQALVTTGLPYADDSSAAVRRSMRRYGREWLNTADAQCDATGVVPDCLKRSLEAFGETLATMTELTAAEAERATGRLDGLLSPARCSATTAEGLSTPAQVELLTAAEVALAAGDHVSAAAVAEELLEKADSLPWHMRADGLAVLGTALSRQNDERAVDSYVEAYQIAVTNNAGELATDMAWRAAVEYSLHDNTTAASTWAKRQEAQAARSGSTRKYPPHELQCRLLKDGHSYAQARPLCEKALAAMESGDVSTQRYRSLLQLLANLYSRAGEPEKGLQMSQKLLDEAIEQGGRLHPRTGGMHMNLGNAYVAMGNSRKAAEHAAAARQVFMEVYGRESRWVVSATMNLAANLNDLGDQGEAESLLVGLLPVLESVGPLQRARVLNNLAGIRVGQGRYDEGLALLAKVEAIETAELRPDDPQTAATRMTQAWAYAGLERWVEAAEKATEAITIRNHVGETWQLAGSFHCRAFVYRRLGRFDDALSDVSTMLQLTEAGEVAPTTRLTALLDGALTMVSAKRWSDAATFTADSRATMTDQGDVTTTSEVAVLELLEAQIRVANGGDAASALVQAEPAYEQLEQTPYLAYPLSEAKAWMDSAKH